MTEFWFDTRTGDQLIGDAAIAQRMEESAPGDILPLGVLLEDSEAPENSDIYERLDGKEWSEDDLRILGQWATKLVLQEGKSRTLVTRHLKQLATLGIGPTIKYIEKNFGTLANYRRDLEVPIGVEKNRYDNWGLPDFVRYAKSLQDELPKGRSRRLKLQDYIDGHAAGKGPSYNIIYKRTGGVRPLNELLGFPNTASWDEEDYVNHGVAVVEANGPVRFIPALYDIVASRKQGPWFTVAVQKFGTWSAYKERVLQEYEAAQNQRQERLDAARRDIKEGRLPVEFDDLPDSTLTATVARYRLIDHLAPTMEGDQKIRGSMSPSGQLIPIVRKHNAELSAGRIEMIAVTLDLFDDIWPISTSAKNLKVSEAELIKVRKHRAKLEAKRLTRLRSEGK